MDMNWQETVLYSISIICLTVLAFKAMHERL